MLLPLSRYIKNSIPGPVSYLYVRARSIFEEKEKKEKLPLIGLGEWERGRLCASDIHKLLK